HVKQIPLLLALGAYCVQGCRDHTTSGSNLPTASITIGRNTYTLEIAAKMHEREKGLMQRDSMPKDHGMIFLFASAQVRRFWMKNTRFALDIVFLDDGGKIVSIHRMEPYVTEKETASKAPAKYAIE